LAAPHPSAVSQSNERRERAQWVAPLLLSAALVAGAIIAGLYARPPLPPGGVPGRALPRMPGPPPDFRALLWSFGVGSVVWYAAAVALPFMLWGARRLDVDRHSRWRTTAIVLG